MKLVSLKWSCLGLLEQGLANKLSIVGTSLPVAQSPLCDSAHVFIHSLMRSKIVMEYPQVKGIVLNDEASGEAR